MVLDAHPNAMVANEFDLFGRLEKGKTMDEALKQICLFSKKHADKMEKSENPKGYSFKMGQKHGEYDDNLELIGIRKSYVTMDHFIYHREEFIDSYER